jgi:hypothetical protein
VRSATRAWPERASAAAGPRGPSRQTADKTARTYVLAVILARLAVACTPLSPEAATIRQVTPDRVALLHCTQVGDIEQGAMLMVQAKRYILNEAAKLTATDVVWVSSSPPEGTSSAVAWARAFVYRCPSP